MKDLVFYVSPNGNDNWSGRFVEVNNDNSDGPFATLTAARDAIRRLKRTEGLRVPVTVMVRQGKYFLSETFVLKEEDSGTKDCPIRYRAYSGENPVISGGKRITNWKSYKDNIVQAEIPCTRGEKWEGRQLFCNGKRMMRARWPKLDSSNPLYSGWALTEGPAEEGSAVAFKYRPGTFRHHWASPDEGEVSYYGGTGGWLSKVRIKSIDEENRIVTLVREGYMQDLPVWYSYQYAFASDNRFYVENLLEELDQPGQWCFNAKEGMVYFWPPEDSGDEYEVTVPVLNCLVDLSGASWITVTGFTFTETTDGDALHPDGIEGCGAMYVGRMGWKYIGDCMRLRNAENCLIEGNHFYAVGGNAIYLKFTNAHNVIRHNEISYAGANGVCLSGAIHEHPFANEVCDNHIHHCGIINKGVAGVFTGMSNGNMIHHNKIEYMPHHGINLSDTPNGRNIVEYNEIRFTCQENEDNGAINIWMEKVPRHSERCGHVIRHNLITDTYGCGVRSGNVGPATFFSNGIYLDNYTSNCIVQGNIIVRSAQCGIVVHAGKNNVIENNIIIDCQVNVRLQDCVSSWKYWSTMGGFMTGNYISRNIFYQSSQDSSVYGLHAWTDEVAAQADYNIIYNKSGEYKIHHMSSLVNGISKDVSLLDEDSRLSTLQKWLELGYDKHSLIKDPKLVCLGEDMYDLSPDSPAFSLGFEPIDISQIGPRVSNRYEAAMVSELPLAIS